MAIIDDRHSSLRADGETGGEFVGRTTDCDSLTPVGRVGDVDSPYRVREPGAMVLTTSHLGMGECDETRIRLTGRQGQGEALRARTPDDNALFGALTVPEERNSMSSCPLRCRLTGTDQEVAFSRFLDDFEALASCRADDNHLIDPRVSAERVRSPDRHVPGYEDTDPHEGSTGDQDSGGSGSLLRPSNAAASPAAAAASNRSAETRFT